MQHRAMANVAVFIDDGIGLGRTVQHTGILHVAAGLDDDAPEIPAQAGQRPNIDPWPDNDVANQNGTGVNKRSEEHTSELQSLMRISTDVFSLKKKNNKKEKSHKQ